MFHCELPHLGRGSYRWLIHHMAWWNRLSGRSTGSQSGVNCSHCLLHKRESLTSIGSGCNCTSLAVPYAAAGVNCRLLLIQIETAHLACEVAESLAGPTCVHVIPSRVDILELGLLDRAANCLGPPDIWAVVFLELVKRLHHVREVADKLPHLFGEWRLAWAVLSNRLLKIPTILLDVVHTNHSILCILLVLGRHYRRRQYKFLR